MTFTAALAFAVLTLIAREDPTMRDRAPETFAAFQQSVGKLVPLHIETAKPGHLVSPEMDALILASVNYAETRFRLPAPKGDCYRTHRYRGVPSMRWPKGYVPKMQWVCPAVGPMNIAQGNRLVVHEWPEVVSLLPGIVEERLTVKAMEQSATNIRLAYGILHHWKNACPNKGKPASVASWLTAYRWGRCTPQHWNKRHFDGEARVRCERIDTMADIMRQQGVPVHRVSCTPEVRVAAR